MLKSKALKKITPSLQENDFSLLLNKNRVWDEWLENDDVEKYVIEEGDYKIIAIDYHLGFTLYNMYILDSLRESPYIEQYLKINFDTELENLKDRIYSLEGIDTGEMLVWVFEKGRFLFVKVIKQSNTIDFIKNKGV